jgi:hypothetical protein
MCWRPFGDLGVNHISIAPSIPNVGMVEHLLHELQVAGLAERLGRQIVPEVVKAESSYAGGFSQAMPVRP